MSIFGIPGHRFSVQVPTCRKCVRRYQIGTIVRLLVYFAAAGAALFVAWYFLNVVVPVRHWKLAVFAVVTTAAVLFFAVSAFFSPVVDITLESDSVIYEFRDAEYARHFADLNSDAEWIGVEE